MCCGLNFIASLSYGMVIKPIVGVYTPRKTNMDTQNDGLEHVSPFNMAIFGIYVKFLGFIYPFKGFPIKGGMTIPNIYRVDLPWHQ